MNDVSPEVFGSFLAISRSIAGQLDYRAVLQAFDRHLQQLILHDHADIVLLAEDGRVHVCYEVGLSTMWSELAETPLPTASSPVRSVLWGHEPHLLTKDACHDKRFHFQGALDAPIYSAKLRSRIIVPLRVQGQVFGSLNISNHRVGVYRPDQVVLAQNCADLIAPYLFALQQAEDARKAGAAENMAKMRAEVLREGALQLTQGMEAERRRLAMDIHDQTLGDLARILRRISVLRASKRRSSTALAELEADLAATLSELRRIVDHLNPGVLELFGFADAVEALLQKCATAMGVRTRIFLHDRGCDAIARIPEVVRTTLYRIVQEAVNNATVHSGASTVGVSVWKRGAAICIEICDDGIGCRQNEAASSGGISNMRTRAELIGARFAIRPGCGGKGTRVRVLVPAAEYERSRSPVQRRGGASNTPAESTGR